jgi:hypothetical protein
MSWVQAAGPARDRAIEQGKELGAAPSDFGRLEGVIAQWMNLGKSPQEFLATIENHVTGNPVADIMAGYPPDLTWDDATVHVYELIDAEGWTPRIVLEALEL